ncbi:MULTISPECIES: hypothetical protein [unclassified Bartonella]|uniref:hypothetical protein n=1 Tax=unclassified Bartonella TaxID=2645622 RepID=UPI0035D009CC
MSINAQTILCLDLDTKTGWTISRVDRNITSGTVNFESYRFEGDGMCYLRFQQWLTKMKVTTDKGNASKEEMINAVCAKGHALQDHLKNSLLAKANLVRKAVLNIREKRLKKRQ